MNYGPLVFLAALFALAASWFGFVLTPQIQLGNLQPTNTVPAGVAYPAARPGLARDGLDVYRANGCAWCHSQQVNQTGTICEVELTNPGTNRPALATALTDIGLSEAEAERAAQDRSKPVLSGVTKQRADNAAKALTAAGAKAQVRIIPVGPDIARGWGKRHSVAEDFLYDSPVMLGSVRVGPDLADVGSRRPDINWHLRHFYAPRLEVKGSTMPPYRFLFEKRKIERMRSPEALALPPELAPPAGYEIVPKTEALALADYMVSLRADAPLFTTPMTVASASSNSTSTNAAATAGVSTNAPAGVATNAVPFTNAELLGTTNPPLSTNSAPSINPPAGSGATNAPGGSTNTSPR